MKGLPVRRVVLVVAVAAAAGVACSSGSEPQAPPPIPLLDRYARAEKRSNLPLGDAFSLGEVTIGGETRRAVTMHPTSRLTFRGIDLPHDAWLQAWIALRPEVWAREEGDGVLFRFGVADDRSYDDLVREHVDPQHRQGDRRWIPLLVDLSPYGGLVVDLIFNTESTLPGGADNPTNDWALWGSPEIVVTPP